MAPDVRIAFAGLAALALAQGIGRFAFTPLLPMMQDDAGVTLAQGGALAAANYLGYLLGALWATCPAPAAAAIRASTVVVAAATLAMGFAEGMAAWAALRFVAGVASAWSLVYVSAWCLARLSANLIGVVFAGVGSGVALAGLLCLALARAGASSAQVWILLGIVALVITAFVWPVFSGSAGGAKRQDIAPLVWTPEAVRLVVCYTAYGLAYVIPATFVPAMARAIVPDPAVFGWAWPLFGGTAAASTLLVARSQSRFGARRVWFVSMFVLAAGTAAPVVLPGLLGIGVAAVLVGGTFVVMTMAGLQVAREVAGAGAPPLMAAMTAGFGLGQVAGPLVVAQMGDRGIPLALAGSALLCAASAFALGWKEKPCTT
jgi:predicted MFS family arabinose efflux permease